jgi:TatD DNase family protein
MMTIDTHCHLHDPVYADLRETISRALNFDVWGVIAVGCDHDTNRRTLEAARVQPKAVWPALGFHPERGLDDAALERVEAQIAREHARIVAVGEIGLPWYTLATAADPPAAMTAARRRLRRLLRLAARYDLPVSLHAPHGAAVGALEALRSEGVERAVFHWHKAPVEVTRAILDAGYHVSVTPDLVHRERDRELVEIVPIDRLLVESDGPWPYQGEFQGTPSGPWLVSRVAEEVAKIKRLPVDETMHRLSANACELFGLPWA